MLLDYRRVSSPTTSFTINIANKISCYKKLSINNFWFQYVNGNGATNLSDHTVGATVGNFYNKTNGQYATHVVTNIGSYDANTGILTVTTTMPNSTILEVSTIAVYLEE